ncbi:hypothetical protein T492DRAFT_850361 [Pavlovales sp. CCMP2436]|nr:hypothetical protein T492DRAFT_850361 [Pavlovales sp. CCMP2436]
MPACAPERRAAHGQAERVAGATGGSAHRRARGLGSRRVPPKGPKRSAMTGCVGGHHGESGSNDSQLLAHGELMMCRVRVEPRVARRERVSAGGVEGKSDAKRTGVDEGQDRGARRPRRRRGEEEHALVHARDASAARNHSTTMPPHILGALGLAVLSFRSTPALGYNGRGLVAAPRHAARPLAPTRCSAVSEVVSESGDDVWEPVSRGSFDAALAERIASGDEADLDDDSWGEYVFEEPLEDPDEGVVDVTAKGAEEGKGCCRANPPLSCEPASITLPLSQCCSRTTPLTPPLPLPPPTHTHHRRVQAGFARL